MDFDGLVDRYEKPIFNLIYRLVGDYEEAADLTQETFVAAYRSFAAFRGESSVYTWLYRIAINKCKNSFKKGAKSKEIRSSENENLNDEACIAAFTPARSDGPEHIIERRELRQQIEDAIGKLPYDYRIVFVLRDLHGLSYQEIAEAADLSVDVVRTRLARARRC